MAKLFIDPKIDNKMFRTKDYVMIALGGIASILSNILTYLFVNYEYFVHYLYLSIICLLIWFIVIIYRKLSSYYNIGIIVAESNLSIGSNTEKILDKAQNNFSLMGRSGSRFIEAKNFETTISRCERRVPIRFLFLQPNSPACERLSNERNVSSSHASDILIASLKSLKKFKDKGYNIEVKVYDNPKYIPSLRIVTIDNQETYVSHYPRCQTGKESFQLVVSKKSPNGNDLFQAFSNYFESSWEVAKEVNLEFYK